ncbi:MAG: TetR family transcriptional regulator [Desulfobacterales bacterium]|nr:TetR family transcriptional regulator [Desulfobacterales bacterium]
MKQDKTNKEMKIGQLSKESHVNRSTIHHYIKVGLLHRPKKVGLNLSLYDETHLTKLKQIRHLRETEGLFIAKIKERLGTDQSAQKPGKGNSKGHIENGPHHAKNDSFAKQKREMILDKAIELFSQRGYEDAKISDITDALHMGKGTFYLYFKNKKELFLECIDRLTFVIVPQAAWNGIREEKDLQLRLFKRGLAFLEAFPSYSGILNLLRMVSSGNDPRLAQKAKETFKIMANPLIRDLRRGMADGKVRKFDEELVGHFLLALGESLGYRLMVDSRYTIEHGLMELADFLTQGLLPQKTGEAGKGGTQVCSGEITDRKGTRIQLQGISFKEKNSLRGRLGEGEIAIDMKKVASISIKKKNLRWFAEMDMKNGEQFSIEVEGDLTLSGEAPFGTFRISLKNVAQISLQNTEKDKEAGT